MNTETISLPAWNLTITEINGDNIEIKGRQFKPALRADFRRHDSVDHDGNTFVMKESSDVFESRTLAYEIAIVNGLEFLCPFYLIGGTDGVMDAHHVFYAEDMMPGFVKSELFSKAFGGESFNTVKFPHSFMFNRNSCKVSPFEVAVTNGKMVNDYSGFVTTTLISTIHNKKMTNFVVARSAELRTWTVLRYKSGRVGFEEIDDDAAYFMVLNILFVASLLDNAKSSNNFFGR